MSEVKSVIFYDIGQFQTEWLNFPYDISSNWYVIAHDANGEFLTIDCSRERLGRCYDSFFDRHGIPGSCAIIATSFTDLLTRLYENKGEGWYWRHSPFVSLGDAYDEIIP